MTNNQIIIQEMILRGITEEIHTFRRWKSMGYSVKKGEKSTIKFPIWKYSTRRKNLKKSETMTRMEENTHL